MKTRLTVGVAAALVLMTSNAVADGPYTRAAAPAPYISCCDSVNWGGFYIGGHVGYGTASLDGVHDSGGAEALWSNADVADAVYGAQVGYNYQTGNVVLGIEVDWSGTNADGAFVDSDGDRHRAELDNFVTIRGRAGLAFGRTLLYLTAGAARFDADAHVELGSPGPNNRFSHDDWGIAYGGGVELDLKHGFSLRAEYLRMSFNSVRSIGAGEINDSDDGDHFKLEDVDVVRVGLNWRFGARREVAPVPMK